VPNKIRMIKEDETSRAYSTHWREGKCNRILMGIPEGKRPLGRHRYRWEDDIKIYVRGI
jgi:hypothetical protein